MSDSRIITGKFCCNCGEGTKGGFCANCPILFCVVMNLSWFLCGELQLILAGFVVLRKGCVMNVDFKDNS